MFKLFKHKRHHTKIIIGSIVVLASVVVSGWALGYGQNNNRDGLVIDIDFSEGNYNSGTRTFTDQSGNGNHAVSTNPATFAPDKDGKSTGAMSFNGVSDQALTSYDFSSAQDVTYSIWFNRLDSNGTRTLIGSGNNDGTIRLSDATITGYWDPSSSSFTSPISIDNQEWHHLVVIKTSGQLNFYVDGVWRWSMSVVNTNINNIEIGHQGTQAERYWQGLISGFRVYNRALSSLEISKLYSDSKPKLTFSSLEKGLIGYWPLNGENYNATTGRATDKSGYAKHGINSGATLSSGRFAEVNGAFDFGGISDGYSVNIADQNFSGLSDFTMSSWILVKGNHQNYDGTIISSGNWNNTHWSFGLAQNNTAIRTRNPSVAAPYTFLANQWYHVVYIRKGTDLKFYVNGAITYTKEITTNIPLSSGYPNTKIGMDTYTANYFNFNGKIADVKMYNRALSDAEVNSLYNYYAPAAGDSLQKGLVLDIPLTSKYTKGGSVGAEVMVDKSPYNNSSQNYLGVLSVNDIDFNAGRNVGVANSDAIDKETFSISLWAKHRNYGYPRTFTAIKKSVPNCYAAGGRGWDIGHAYNANGVDICIADGINRVRNILTFNVGSRPADLANTWAHIVYVVDRNSNKVIAYINGDKQDAEIDISSVTGSIKNSSALTIGTLYGWYIDGNVSHYKMYNRTLTAPEVKSLFDQGRTGSGVIMNQ